MLKIFHEYFIMVTAIQQAYIFCYWRLDDNGNLLLILSGYIRQDRFLVNFYWMNQTISCTGILYLYILLYFDPRPGLKMLFQGDTPEGSDTFQRPVIERDRVGGLKLMIWEKVKVPLCHYSHAPEESNLWTAWQLFPLVDD